MARVDQAVSSRTKIAPCRAPVNKNKAASRRPTIFGRRLDATDAIAPD